MSRPGPLPLLPSLTPHRIAVVVASCILLAQNAQTVEAKNCTKEETTDMQTLFTDCTGRMTTDYHNSLETIDKKEATCELITNIISDCSQIWEECHSEDDIRKMKNMQFEALVGQYNRTVELRSCEFVEQYWTEGGWEEEGSGDECSDREVLQTQTLFQTCSHTISSEAYATLQDLTDATEVVTQICDALTKMSSSCPEKLGKCFTPIDVRLVVRQQLQTYKKYLLDLTEVKVANDSLDDCQALVFKSDDYYNDYEPEYYEDEFTEDEFTEDEYADEAKVLQDLLYEHQSQQQAEQPVPEQPHQNKVEKSTTQKPASKPVKSTKEPAKKAPSASPKSDTSASTSQISSSSILLFVLSTSFFCGTKI